MSSTPYTGPQEPWQPPSNLPQPPGPGQAPAGTPQGPGPWSAPPGAPQPPPGTAVPQAAPAGQPAYLDLTVQGNELWTAMIAPQVHVNGWPLPRQFGRSMVPVPPGRVRIDVDVQWTKKYGQASLDLQMAPGQVVPVFYATPYHVFAKGAIGHVKQRRPGLLALVVPAAVFLALLIGAVVLAAVSSS